MAIWNSDLPVAELVERWAQPPSAFVNIDGMDVHVRDEGIRDAKIPIVLVHGTGNSLHTWGVLALRLRANHRVISFDRPGFGLTGPNRSGDYTTTYYAGFTRRLLDYLEVDRCVLVGSSAGGRVAWRFAVAEPGRVEKLVLIAAAGYPRTIPQAFGFRVAMSPIGSFVLHVLPKSAMATSIRRTYGDPSKVTDETIDRTYDVFRREGVRNALGPALRQAETFEDSPLIKRVVAPTLIIWGDKDPVLPVADGELFQADIRGSRLVTLAGVGHLPQEEAPDETYAAISTFIGEDALV